MITACNKYKTINVNRNNHSNNNNTTTTTTTTATTTTTNNNHNNNDDPAHGGFSRLLDAEPHGVHLRDGEEVDALLI